MLYHISFKIQIKPAVLEKESVQNYKLLTSAEGIWCDKDKKHFIAIIVSELSIQIEVWLLIDLINET